MSDDDALQQLRGLLSPKEREIFDAIAVAAGEIVPRSDLLRLLAGRAPRTLDTYLKQIRSKMRSVGLDPRTLRTHTGKGYAYAARL